MQHEAARAAETHDWLNKCTLDLRAAEFDLTAVPPLTGDVVFHAQQLAEKSLKAFLTWHDVPFRKTHNLNEIGGQCVAIDPSLSPLIQSATELSEYAWKYRYPGEPAEPDEVEARDALVVARDVLAAILALLPGEVRP